MLYELQWMLHQPTEAIASYGDTLVEMDVSRNKINTGKEWIDREIKHERGTNNRIHDKDYR